MFFSPHWPYNQNDQIVLDKNIFFYLQIIQLKFLKIMCRSRLVGYLLVGSKSMSSIINILGACDLKLSYHHY